MLKHISISRYFEYQLTLSKEHNLPLFLHCRAAADDLVEILHRNEDKIVGGVVHSFDGSKEAVDKILALGLYIGINGWSVLLINTTILVLDVRKKNIYIQQNNVHIHIILVSYLCYSG